MTFQPDNEEKKWTRIYKTVLVFSIIIVILLYLFSQTYSA